MPLFNEQWCTSLAWNSLSTHRGQQLVTYTRLNFAGLGKSDAITLWYEPNKKIDSVRMGPDNGLAIVPAKATWCRQPDSSGVFTVCSSSEGVKNGDSDALPADQVQALIAEEKATEVKEKKGSAIMMSPQATSGR